MLAARAPLRAIAPASDYVTKPGRLEIYQPRAVMHHYVGVEALVLPARWRQVK